MGNLDGAGGKGGKGGGGGEGGAPATNCLHCQLVHVPFFSVLLLLLEAERWGFYFVRWRLFRLLPETFGNPSRCREAAGTERSLGWEEGREG